MDKIEGKPFGQPANDIEKQWLLDRLKTLSAREAYQLAAMMLTTGRLREVSGKEGDELLLAVLKLAAVAGVVFCGRKLYKSR